MKRKDALTQSLTGKNTQVQTIGLTSHDPDKMAASNEREHGVPQLGFSGNRKRQSAAVKDDGYPSATKKPRTDLDPVCSAMNNIGLDHLLAEGNLHTTVISNQASGDRGKGGGCKGGKKKVKTAATEDTSCDTTASKRSAKPAVDPDVMLKNGELLKEEVSHILLRMPDGSRLHKTFLRSAPVKVCK